MIELGDGKPKKSFGEKIEQLADRIVDEALGIGAPEGEEVSLSTRMAAFKMLSAYHLGLLKVKHGDNGDDPDDDSSTDFAGMKSKIHAVT